MNHTFRGRETFANDLYPHHNVAESDAIASYPVTKLMKMDNSPENSIDMFSDLPRHLIHYIMLSLPTRDSTRMSLLSKRFLSAWRSFPVIDFDYDVFACRSHGGVRSVPDFLAFVEDSIRYRRLGSDVLESLVFRFDYYMVNRETVPSARAVMKRMVNFAVRKRVKELILACRDGYIGDVLRKIFSSNSIKTLKLSGINLGDSKNLVLNCRLIEVLRLIKCDSPSETTIKLSSARLKSAVFDSCAGLERIEIEEAAASLECFSFCGTHEWIGNYEIINLGSCKSLRSLHLEGINITDEWFKNVIPNLAELEDLELKNCGALKNVALRNKRLQIVDLQDCQAIENIDAVAQNLEVFQHSLRFDVPNSPNTLGQCKVDISRCKNLKELHLKGVRGNLTDKWIRENITGSSGFPLLEKLVLADCSLLKRFKFRATKLKALELIYCNNLRSAEIDAPNLVSFVYSGVILRSPPLIIISTNLITQLNLVSSDNDCKKFRDFLSYFGHCKSLTLVCNCNKLIFPDEHRSRWVSPMYDLKHLNIRLKDNVASTVELIDNLLWLSPRLNTLVIDFGSRGSIVLKFYYKLLLNPNEYDKNQPVCCGLRIIKCWRHYLQRVDVKAADGFEAGDGLRRFFMENSKTIQISFQ